MRRSRIIGVEVALAVLLNITAGLIQRPVAIALAKCGWWVLILTLSFFVASDIKVWPRIRPFVVKSRLLSACISIALASGLWFGVSRGCDRLFAELPNSPESQRENHSGAAVEVLFAQSPELTPDRKARISGQVVSFYAFLSTLGFPVPHQTAPLSILDAKYDAAIRSFTIAQQPGASSLLGHIDFTLQSADDPVDLLSAYGIYALDRLIANDPNADDITNREAAAFSIGYYLAWDYLNRTKDSRGDKWSAALWDVRQRFGSSFVNQSLLIATRGMNDRIKSRAYYKRPDMYLSWYFEVGENAASDDAERLIAVDKILRAHQITTVQ